MKYSGRNLRTLIYLFIAFVIAGFIYRNAHRDAMQGVNEQIERSKEISEKQRRMRSS